MVSPSKPVGIMQQDKGFVLALVSLLLLLMSGTVYHAFALSAADIKMTIDLQRHLSSPT